MKRVFSSSDNYNTFEFQDFQYFKLRNAVGLNNYTNYLLVVSSSLNVPVVGIHAHELHWKALE